MANYNVSVTQSTEFPPIDIGAGTPTTYSIDNPSNGSSYFVLDTTPNSNGGYDITSPKNLEGLFSTSEGITDLVKDDYKLAAVVAPGGGVINFTPTNYISGSTLKIKGMGGSRKIPQFISTWDTTLPGTSNTQSITLPLKSGLQYDMVVNWGDGTFTEVSSSTQGDLTHEYSATGSYKVYITGKFEGWRFVNGGDKTKITGIENWGNYEVNNLTAQFQGCSNLTINTSDGPLLTPTSRPHAMFSNSNNTTSSMSLTRLGKWDVGQVSKDRAYSGNIDWSAMFYDSNTFRSGKFNQDISDWDMTHAKDLRVFFGNQAEYNQPMNDWNVSNVRDFEYMFFAAQKFNQPLDKWNISNATRIRLMFYLASSFNQDIGSWDVSNITSTTSTDGLYGVFYGAKNFDNGGSDSIKNWDVSNIANFAFCFGFSGFNQPIGNWDVSSGSYFRGMFGYGLDVESEGADVVKFNQNLGSWDMGNATDISVMFQRLPTFNNGGSDSIRNWNTSKVTTINGIFQTCSMFNQPLDGWDTSLVTDFSRSFCGATSFDQDLSSWNIESAQTMSHMFTGVTLSTPNYDALLVSWASQSLQSNIVFDGGNSKYTGTFGSEPSASRAKMIDTYNWTITDGGPV